MVRVQLIHRHAATSAERADVLTSMGYQVDFRPFGREVLGELRASPPDAFVIDLGRAPSFGRDVAVSIRTYKATRQVPIVFVGGDPQQVARIQALLPDAAYTTWADIGSSLTHAIAHPPDNPSVPASVMEAYRGTPLVKKLGIKPTATVVLVGAPDGFEQLLAGLSDDVQVRRSPQGKRDLTLWFVRSKRELEDRVAEMGSYAEGGGLWIIWPKKASGMDSDVSQTAVRAVGLAAGLVDFKVCSVDAIWSGLRFSARRTEGA
jgi:CheY-like chemotaxis protein